MTSRVGSTAAWCYVVVLLLFVPMLLSAQNVQASLPTSTNLSVVENGTSFNFTAVVSGSGATSPGGSVELFDTSNNTAVGTKQLTPIAGQYQTLKSSLASAPSAITSGDYDEDGYTDLILLEKVPNYAIWNLHVLRGSASGAFVDGGLMETPEYAWGGGASSLISVDLNGDHHLDLAMAAYDGTSVFVFLGSGAGSFTASPRYLLKIGTYYGSYPSTIAAADFNNDGKLDLGVGTGYGDFWVLDGNGDGTFTVGRWYGFVGGNWPTSMTVADFNNDGKLDTVFAASYNSAINVFLGNGDGTFQQPTYFTVSGTPRSIVSADFDSDGNIDLAIGSDGANRIYIYKGRGDGTFALSTSPTAGQTPLVLLYDVNGDGKSDLIASTDTPTDVPYERVECLRVYINDGTGIFTSEPYVGFNVQTVGTPVLGRFSDSASLGVVIPVWNFDDTHSMNLILRASASSAAWNGATFSGGTHVLEARYTPDEGGTYAASTSNQVSVVGGALKTTTSTLTSSLNPAKYGEDAVFTATVTSTTGTPSGRVHLMDGATEVAAADLASGAAEFHQKLSVGTHSLTIVYDGDSTFGASTSAALSQIVNKNNVTVTLAASPASVAKNENFTLTATVTAPYTNATGTITFQYQGDATFGEAALNNGVATFTRSYDVEGPLVISAWYPGDANYFPVNSGTVTVNVKSATTTTMTSSTNPIVYGTGTTLTATVTAAVGTPAGEVEFFDDDVSIVVVQLNASGVATATADKFPAGTHAVTAVYRGGAAHAPSTSAAVMQTVTKATSSTVIAAAKNVVHLPSSLVLNATVTSSAGKPTGTVGFTLGTTYVGSSALDANGKATLTVQNPTAGQSTITAAYEGDNNFNSSTSTAVPQWIFPGAPEYTLTATPTQLTLHRGETGQIAITMTPSNGYDGTVSFDCAGLAIGMTCSFAPAQVAGNLEGNAAHTMLTITTTGPAKTAANTNSQQGPSLMMAVWTLGICGMFVAGTSRKRRPTRRLLTIVALITVVWLTVVPWTACGNSGTPPNWTPLGTVTSTVTAGATATSTGVQATQPTKQVALQITITN